MLSDLQDSSRVIFARRLASGDLERVRLDATVTVLAPNGHERDSADPQPALAAALAYWVGEAEGNAAYAESIISGEPTPSPQRAIQEVTMR